MDLDPTLRGGLEMGLKICPMKTSGYNKGMFRTHGHKCRKQGQDECIFWRPGGLQIRQSTLRRKSEIMMR